MFSTSTQIVNQALHHLGVQRINSLTDDNKRAQLMNDLYTQVRDDVLRSATWGFAMKRAQLAEASPAPAFEFSKNFSIPADCLKVHQVWDYNPGSSTATGTSHPFPFGVDYSDEDLRYKVEGDLLLANADTIYIRYISRQTDVSKYSPDFIRCLSLELAASACFSLTQNRGLRKELLQEAEIFRRAASAHDAQESSPDGYEISTFIKPRY